MSMCRLFPCVVGRGYLLWPLRSLGRTLLAFALLHSVLQGQICRLLQFLDFLLLHIKKQRHYLVNKGPSSQGYGFSGSHVWMWELDYKESWAQKNWCFWTVMLEKTLGVPWTARRSNPSILKKISFGCSLEGLMLKLATDGKNWLIWKDPNAGKDGRQEEKGTTEDEMVGWHHWLNGHEFE